jgi:ribosomal protein L11 methyltransferase
MEVNKKYFELQIKFNEQNYDLIYNLLYLHRIKNILEEDSKIKIYFPEEESKRLSEIKIKLISDSIINRKDISLKSFRNRNWEEEWKKTIKPVFIKDKIIVYASWCKKDIRKYKDKILIEIAPKMSFGTGHNETTRLVLELMCDYIDSKDKYLLDYGSGTGVLAIAGIKLGINKAIAIDIDEDSIANSIEYVKKNKTEQKIHIYKKNITDIREKNFDVICANLTSPVIEENFNSIKLKTATNGKIFLSGILKKEENKMIKILKQNSFIIYDIRNDAEWIGIYARKNRIG